MMRILTLLSVVIVGAAILTGALPDARIEMGTAYRINHIFEGISSTTPTANLMVRFPSGSSNAIPASYERSVRWIHVWYDGQSWNNDIKIYTSAAPGGMVIQRASWAINSFSFGGCRIDSLEIVPLGTTARNIHVFATD